LTEIESIMKKSLKEYQFLINNILDVIVEVDLDGTFTYVNPQVKDMFGYNPKEVIGTPFFSYIHPDDMPVIMETLEKAIRGKGIVSIEYRVRHKKGHYVHVFAKGSLVKLDDKPKIVGVLRDITEYKEAEQKLKESEENFREITEQSFMGICIIQDSSIKYINHTITKMLGYSEKEIMEWSMKEFLNVVHPEDRALAIKRLSNRQKGLIDEKLDRVYRIFTKSGEIKWMDTYSKIIQYQGKDAILATLVDITEMKETEQKLLESEIKYHALFEQAADSIVLIDTKNGNIIDYNDRMYENLGYTREEFKNIRVPDFDLMEEDEDYRAHIKTIIREGSDVFETKYKTKTGEVKDILVSAKAITIEDKTFLYSILRDVTKQKQVEKELREINTLKSELLERTSHELKTPLISIKGFTDLLLDLHKDKFDGEVLSILGEIKHGTDRLETIINKLLESSILESGKIQFKPSKEDLSFLIKFCVKNLRGLAKTRNHFINLDIPDKIILSFEKERIYEVVTHLIINAIKYTPPYGEIKIQTEKTDEYVIVTVQDNGIGLSKDEKKKLFKQFGKIERYGQGWDIGIEGTGMGLYTSKKIVELHGGEIWVESEGRNKGTKFCFSLPLNKD